MGRKERGGKDGPQRLYESRLHFQFSPAPVSSLEPEEHRPSKQPSTDGYEAMGFIVQQRMPVHYSKGL